MNHRTILDHIQKQQDAAANLETVLSALEDLRLANLSPKVQTELIVMSRTLAHDLALALDIVNLPREVAA
ncbi:hypothetical protein LO749_16830 [Paracoccus denitrificans]|uniref:hypothetical protein n=1 Tax=Paracoccus denitrificans TaxID=266 RepID=UPI001E40627A|nr:hypothetical protein [Paracoccus denitrificans]UFS67756.1 hypothetical protein LO749_16830 [Paracoccus denitrificans]